MSIGRTEMSAAASLPHTRTEDGVETPSGKWREGENFPVGSWLIRRELRPHVHAFYRFARNADDIADNPALWRRATRCAGSTAWRRCSTARRATTAPAAAAMRQSLLATGMTAQHCHDVLRAFRLDANKLRYRDWDDLMEYCRYSAAPVGRQLLDLHGESRDDLARLGCAVLGAAGAQPSAGLRRGLPPARPGLPAARRPRRRRDRRRGARRAGREPGLRRVLDRLLDRTARARSRPRADWRRASPRAGCAANARSSSSWRRACSRRLRRGDPLARPGRARPDRFRRGLC